jgi:hypothetical protein
MSESMKSCACALHRRRFLQLAGGASFAALPFAAFAQPAPAAPLPVEPAASALPIEERVLLLICNEPVVWQSANNYMKSRNLVGKYQHMEVEGAAIGLIADQFKASSKASWDALVAATTPSPPITKVIALNHRGCSAIKIAYDVGKLQDKLMETETHRFVLREFRKQFSAHNPALPVEIGLIGLDGKVEMFT